jgi:hypothetical protein
MQLIEVIILYCQALDLKPPSQSDNVLFLFRVSNSLVEVPLWFACLQNGIPGISKDCAITLTIGLLVINSAYLIRNGKID